MIGRIGIIMTKLDVFVGIVFFISIFAAIFNYSTWVVYRDGWDYYYAKQKNGWWTLFYIVIAILSAGYVEGWFLNE